jgi:hypothetical protein
MTISALCSATHAVPSTTADSPEGHGTFGFDATYVKKSPLPQGNTEFQFQAGGLNFRGASYDWLLVSNSDHAKVKRSGTSRIRIWWAEGETEHVVYDNARCS